MIKALLIAFPCIGIYIGIVLAAYAVFNKVDPYDEATDFSGDGDVNKCAAALWPISIPLLLFCCMIDWIGGIMDLIREYQKDGDN